MGTGTGVVGAGDGTGVVGATVGTGVGDGDGKKAGGRETGGGWQQRSNCTPFNHHEHPIQSSPIMSERCKRT